MMMTTSCMTHIQWKKIYYLTVMPQVTNKHPLVSVSHITELNSICLVRRAVCQEVKVGSLTTYSACTSPHYGHIRSTCGEVTNILISEDFSSQRSANRFGLGVLTISTGSLMVEHSFRERPGLILDRV